MSKKLIALLLAFTLMFSTLTMAFADTAIGEEAAIAEALGMLKGDGNGVTPEYLATQPTRLQAAIMYLRLRGLEEEALEWTGTENFPDGTDYVWDGGKAIMAYLKSHPELGWQGADGMFLPNEKVNAQSFYKVMLEALGYKQNTTDVIGDFTWAGTFNFAADLGMIAVADVAEFTVNDLAIATLEGLVIPVKSSELTLIATLVEAGIIDMETAVSVGLYEDPAVVELENAIAAAEAAIAALPAEITLAHKAHVEEARELVDAVAALDAEAVIENIAVLEAAEAKIAEIEANATLESIINGVNAVANTKIEITLTDAITSVDATSFSIKDAANNSLEVKSATLSTDGKTVKLVTAAQTANTLYTVTVGAKTVKFVGLASETTKPQLVSAVATTNTKVVVTFNEAMDADTALNIANYAINNNLTVIKAELSDDKLQVTLTTSIQVVGTIYKIVVTNVTDTAANVINADYDEFQFGGLPADATKPQLTSAVATTNTKITLDFNEDLDKETAENIANYTIAGLTVLKAELADNRDDVVLTTTAQTVGTIYKVVVANVTDESGNVINADYDEFQFGGLATDATAPRVLSAVAANNTTVKVTFNEAVDAATAALPYNYYLGTELGYPTNVVKDTVVTDGTVWVLTTAAQKAKIYTVDATGIADLSGNILDENYDDATFGGIAVNTNDITAPKVVSAIAIDNKTLVVTFNEAMDDTTIAVGDFTFAVSSGTETLTAIAGATATGIKVADDGMSVKLQFNNETMTPGVLYKVTVATVDDLAGNAVDASYDEAVFAGTSLANAVPVVSSAVLLNNQTLKITFSEAMSIAGAVTAADFAFSPAYAGVVTNYALSADGKELTVYFSGATFAAGTVYTVTINDNNNFYDELNVVEISYANNDEVGTFAGINTVAATPKITAVVAVDQNTIDITFDQPVTSTLAHSVVGDITIQYNGGAYNVVDALVRAEGTTGNKIRVFFDNSLAFVSGNIYKVIVDNTKVLNKNGVAMVAADNNALFAAVSTTNAAPAIAAASQIDATHIQVVFTEKITNVDTDGADFAITGATLAAAGTSVDSTGKIVTIELTAPLTNGIKTVSITGAGILDEAGVGGVNTSSTMQFVYNN